MLDNARSDFQHSVINLYAGWVQPPRQRSVLLALRYDRVYGIQNLAHASRVLINVYIGKRDSTKR